MHLRELRRGPQQAWLLQTAIKVWDGFEAGFRALWLSHARTGDAHPTALYPIADGRRRTDVATGGVSGDANGSLSVFDAGCAVRSPAGHAINAVAERLRGWSTLMVW